MNNFENTELKIGTVKAGAKKVVLFKGKETLPEIRLMTASCSCTKPTQVGNDIKVVFRPGNFPRHLLGVTQYESRKNIKVYYKDGTQEMLCFSALIKRK